MTENNNNIYIPSIDAKDLFISNNYTSGENAYNLKSKNGAYNVKKFINTLDYSLESIELRKVYQKAYRRSDFTFVQDKKEYTSKVINVTFKYSVKEFNKINNNTYVKFGVNPKELSFVDNVYVVDGELLAIKTDKEVKDPIQDDMLGSYFYYVKSDEDIYGHYDVKKNIKGLYGVSELRTELYKNGFVCDGIRYVRFKRSSGSARVGKCLFIDENLYSRMHRWECCGLTVKKAQKIDLAAWESYISLTSSSIIGTLDIKPENILVVDDYESIFTDEVMATRVIDNKLSTKRETVQIKNSIWDGLSLIDISAMAEYAEKGMLLLRNNFFKSCCFNSNIQQWFADNKIIDIKQLNGKTTAKSIEDIKLITTPSSIKFIKFGTLDMWLENIGSTFGVVKYEKPTYYMGGNMVQTHYQLINTLQMSETEVEDLIRPSMDYIKLLRLDPAAMRYNLGFKSTTEIGDVQFNSKNDVVFKMLSINDKFSETKMYNEFVRRLNASFMDNIKKGHILVDGNYSTLLGNPIELLQQAIGKFSGKNVIEKDSIFSKRFEFNKKILGSRSPHVTIGNILLTTNKHNKHIDKYINTTKEIVVVNSINENILNRLSGAD